MVDLTGTRMKLSRAQHHLDAIKHEVEIFKQSEPYTFRLEPDTKPSGHLILCHIDQRPSRLLGLLIGDFAHNARSALDLLVSSITTLPANDSESRGRLQFPICDDPGKFNAAQVQGLVGVGASYKDIIEAAQPYKGRRGNEYLAILRDINNADKHRIVSPVGAIGISAKVRIGQSNVAPIEIQDGWHSGDSWDVEFFGNRVIPKEGMILGRLTKEPNVELDLNAELTIDVQFGKSSAGIEGRLVVAALRGVLDHVKELVGKFK